MSEEKTTSEVKTEKDEGIRLPKVLNDVAETLKKRMYSPVIGTFIIAWFVCNWELLYYIISSSPKSISETDTTIYYIKRDYLNFCARWGKLFVLPLSITLIYLYVIPLLVGILEGLHEFILKQKYRIVSYFKSYDYDELLNKYKILELEYKIQSNERDKDNIYFENMVYNFYKNNSKQVDKSDIKMLEHLMRVDFNKYFIIGIIKNELSKKNSVVLKKLKETDTINDEIDNVDLINSLKKYGMLKRNDSLGEFVLTDLGIEVMKLY